MINSETLQTNVLDWLSSHQHTILTRSMLPKLPAFKFLEKDDLLQAIDMLEQKGLLSKTRLSDGPYASEIIKISPAGLQRTQSRDKMKPYFL